jgi:hypothetical protein
LSAVAVGIICALSVAPVALGALPRAAVARGTSQPRPLERLDQTRRDLGSLARAAPSPAALKLLGRADIELARASVASLWIDPGHLVAPAYGASVFTRTRAALTELERVPASAAPAARVAAIEASILAADRGLAGGAILQAAGGDGGLLARARGMILSGDRWAVTTRLDLAAEQYGAAWQDAFQALTELVVVRATFTPAGVLGRTAEAALQSAAIAPAGVHVVSGRGPLMRSGKPDVLFVGLESCRFCAIERWGVVVALSQFGTFSNLHLSQSATTSPPIVRSFTFHGSHYASPYLAFDPVELFGIVPRLAGGFQPLGHLTPAQRALFRALDPAGSAPFVDVANRFADVGATVPSGLLGATAPPSVAGGSSWSALASSVRHAKSVPGQAVAATAEVITAEICQASGGAPASVCTSAVVQDYSSRLAQFGGRGGGCSVAAAASGLQPLFGRSWRSR